MDYLLQVEDHVFCTRTDEGSGFRLVGHPTQVPLLERCLDTNSLDTKFCTGYWWERSKKPTDVLEQMVKVGEEAYKIPSGSGQANALRFAYMNSQLFLTSVRPDRDEGDLIKVGSLLQELRYHPAVIGGLGFLFNNHFTSSVLDLLCIIYDIERFIKPGREKSLSLLKNYFRLVTSKHIYRQFRFGGHYGKYAISASSGQCVTDPEYEMPRAVVALNAWYTHPFHKVSSEGYLVLFHKKWFERLVKGGQKPSYALVESAWRTTNKLLQFVFWTWVTSLRDQTLDACLFFEDDTTSAAAFQRYLRTTNLDNINFVFEVVDPV